MTPAGVSENQQHEEAALISVRRVKELHLVVSNCNLISLPYGVDFCITVVGMVG